MIYTLEELRAIPIFFIVGKGRSGTTLLSTILDSHPNVASATESRFLLIVWQKYKYLKSWNTENTAQFIEDVKRDILVNYMWEFDNDLYENLQQLPREAQIQDLIKLVYIHRKSTFPKAKITYIIDKNPKYTIFVEKLITIFPDAKFFRLIRDPRDNVTSQIKYSKASVGAIANKWRNYNQTLDSFGKKYPTQFMTLKFEDLILNKELFFQKFEEYSGLDSLVNFEKERLKIKDQFEEKFSDRLKVQHQETVQPLNPKKIGHYKQKLSEKQIEVIESYSFPYAEKWGYKRGLSPMKQPFLKSLRIQLNYLTLLQAHRVYYGLPFSVLLGSRNFILNNFQKNKREKLHEVISKNGN
tara:strand:- start:11797 stop:12861 length:1065 start_codon:yes stop_codon:yes gene_type:complete